MNVWLEIRALGSIHHWRDGTRLMELSGFFYCITPKMPANPLRPRRSP
jgi:hypothetical protein